MTHHMPYPMGKSDPFFLEIVRVFQTCDNEKIFSFVQSNKAEFTSVIFSNKENHLGTLVLDYLSYVRLLCGYELFTKEVYENFVYFYGKESAIVSYIKAYGMPYPEMIDELRRSFGDATADNRDYFFQLHDPDMIIHFPL